MTARLEDAENATNENVGKKMLL